MKNLATLFVLCLIPAIGLTHRILAYFPLPAPSHHFFYEPILRGLAQRGHKIDYYSPFPMKNQNENITHIAVENIFDEATKDVSLFNHGSLPVLEQLSDFMSAGVRFEPILCHSASVRDLISSNTTYDLLIHESMYLAETGVVFMHKFNVPSVVLAALDDFFQLNVFSGLLVNPSYMVSAFTEHSDRMNFIERLHNTYLLAGSMFMEYNHLRRLQKVVDECFIYPGWESRPPLPALLADQSLILVNNHPSVGFPFPRPPHVKEIGGAVIQTRKPLPLDLEEFVNGAEYGIIYFSLGSLFDWKQADANMKDIFLKVFSKRKERILWKLPNNPWESLPSNLRISRWFPQQDILAHANVKLFITHGGLQSTFETVHHGVPVIVIPAFADQIKNSLAITQHGYGLRLLLNNITESSLTWALDEALHQPKYKQQVLKGSALLKDRTMDPVDEGVFWIEFVLRHGRVLQPVGARLNFIQRHCLDILAFVFTFILIIFYSIKKLAFWLWDKISFAVSEFVHKKKQE